MADSTSDIEKKSTGSGEYQPEGIVITAQQTTKAPTPAPSPFPEGGVQAWSCIAGSFCCLFVSFGWINSIGVFQDYYQTSLLSNLSSSTIAWIPSLEVFFLMFGGLPVGLLNDNYGSRWLLLGGTFLHVFGLMMASISTTFYQLLLSQGICSPIGAALVFYPALAASSSWFQRRRAFALGIAISGSSVGGIIFPIMVDRLVRQVGFGWAMRTCAFMILGLLAFSNVTVRSRIPPTPKRFHLRQFWSPLGEIPYLLLTIGTFLFMLGLFNPMNYISLYGRQHSVDENLSSYLLPILNAGGVLGRILPGYLGDRYGRFNVMTVLCFYSGIVTLALWIPSTGTGAIIVYAVLYGFGSGCFVSLLPALIAQISEIREIGARVGVMYAFDAVACLISNPIGGALLGGSNGFLGLQIWCGVCLLAGSAAILASRVVQKGWSLRERV